MHKVVYVAKFSYPDSSCSMEGYSRVAHLYTVSIIKPLYRTGTHSTTLAHVWAGVIIVIRCVCVSVCLLPLYLLHHLFYACNCITSTKYSR